MTQGTIFDDDIYNPHTLKSEIVANYIKVLSFDEALNRQEKLFIAKKWWGMVCDEAQKRCLGDLHKNIEDPDYDILVNHLVSKSGSGHASSHARKGTNQNSVCRASVHLRIH